MSNAALKELLKITKNDPEVVDWIDRWVISISDAQLVVDKKYLDSEYSDIIKTHLVRNVAEELTEIAANYNVEKNKYSMEMIVIRRNGAKKSI